MALDFPTSPASNEIYTYGGRSWQWNGTAWDVYTAPGGLTQYVSQLNGLCGSINIAAGSSISVTPTGNTLTIAYTGGGGGGNTGATGATGPTGPQGNTGATGAIPTDYVISFNGLTGSVTGVSTVNGLTGTVTNVALTTNTLAQFASTTSAQLASIISNETGSGGVLVFNTSPTITTSITTASTSFALVNTTATTLNLGGAATTLTMGGTSGTASIRNATLLLGNTNNTITTNTGTTNYIIIQPYGELRLAPNSTAISLGGTIPSLSVSNTVDAAGFVTVAGGDLLLSTKSTDGLNTTPVNIIFEGATDNTNETTLTVVDPTADRTITFPDASGTVALTSSTVASFNGTTGAVTGVSRFNGLTGGVTLAAGTNITLTPFGNTITINSSGGSGGTYYNFTEGTTVGAGPTAGDRWFDTNTGKLFTAITDGASRIWVEFGGVGPQGNTGATGAVGGVGPQGNTGATGPVGGGSSVYTVNDTLDFSENINGYYLTFSGVGLNESTSLQYVENNKTIVAQFNTAGEIYDCTLDSIKSFYDPTNGWSVRLVVKPPFINTSNFIERTAQWLYDDGGFPTIVYLNITSASGTNTIDSWDTVANQLFYHQEETYVIKTLTGITWVTDSMFLNCKVLGLTSADHTPEDAILEGVRFEINNIVGGTGFDIIGHAPEGTYGKYTIKCLGQ